ncbi:hypothetical protein C8R32_10874 [Nitrosospira sp. Nsp5]|uniref:Uncharacterized protein n=1 Tax=Nitrosospira multiformis TaxID=1231 RepID=A0ABY0T6J6_9PROT|nr:MULTISPECIES: hypothetical protein [Nitrosospira]PTR07118.1 hypothetical protein C8R32_10874 [Nitrosospira sp. Nsp5]SDQ33883.1 hypothetical protein SAMN05216402_0451 [Nitrosospira multiformis]
MSTDYENAMKDAERGIVALEATYGIEALAILATTALEDNEDGRSGVGNERSIEEYRAAQ